MNGVNIEIPPNSEVSSESQQSHISSPGDRWNLLTAGLKCLSMGSAVTLTRLSSPLALLSPSHSPGSKVSRRNE